MSSSTKKKSDRSTQITIRLDPKILEGLHDIASRIGIAPTTVAGMAIGEYVAKNQAQFQRAHLLQETMAKEMARVIGSPLAAIFEGKSHAELKELFAYDHQDEQTDWTEVIDD